MHTEEDIKMLNEIGILSCLALMRKHQCKRDVARNILKSIVDNYENVIFLNEDQIYISGRELKIWKPKPKRYRTLPLKPPRWKDVTKP